MYESGACHDILAMCGGSGDGNKVREESIAWMPSAHTAKVLLESANRFLVPYKKVRANLRTNKRYAHPHSIRDVVSGIGMGIPMLALQRTEPHGKTGVEGEGAGKVPFRAQYM